MQVFLSVVRLCGVRKQFDTRAWIDRLAEVIRATLTVAIHIITPIDAAVMAVTAEILMMTFMALHRDAAVSPLSFHPFPPLSFPPLSFSFLAFSLSFSSLISSYRPPSSQSHCANFGTNASEEANCPCANANAARANAGALWRRRGRRIWASSFFSPSSFSLCHHFSLNSSSVTTRLWSCCPRDLCLRSTSFCFPKCSAIWRYSHLFYFPFYSSRPATIWSLSSFFFSFSCYFYFIGERDSSIRTRGAAIGSVLLLGGSIK